MRGEGGGRGGAREEESRRGEKERRERREEKKNGGRKKSVRAAAEFTGARYFVNRASHGKIECILTYTFLSLPVLYSDSSESRPPSGSKWPPGCLPIAPRQSMNMVGQRYKEEQRRT